MVMSAKTERVIIGVAILALVASIFILSGCGSTQTKIVYERVEVPKPYREYVENVKPTPDALDLQTSYMTPDEARSDPTPALIIVGQDLNLCVSSHELLRRDYEALRLRCIAPPAPAPSPTDPD
jgi:hypothetical protein